MRGELNRESLGELMQELARSAPAGEVSRVYLLGGATAVLMDWRAATIDADLYSESDGPFRRIQEIKERLGVNIELVRPEDFVPALADSGNRHMFIRRIQGVEFFHYDPYAQAFSKIVRGLRKDLLDAEQLLQLEEVEPATLRELVHAIPDEAWNRYPALSPPAVRAVVDEFLG